MATILAADSGEPELQVSGPDKVQYKGPPKPIMALFGTGVTNFIFLQKALLKKLIGFYIKLIWNICIRSLKIFKKCCNQFRFFVTKKCIHIQPDSNIKISLFIKMAFIIFPKPPCVIPEMEFEIFKKRIFKIYKTRALQCD